MNQEETNKNLYLLQRYQEQAEALYGEAEVIERLILDYNRAAETLQEMTTVNIKETLIPIGGNTFAYGALENTDKVIINVGRGILIEKTVNAAIKTINKKIADLKKSQENVMKTAEDIQEKMEEINQNLREKNVQTSQKKN
jgi:prefoldin alpha subunit